MPTIKNVMPVTAKNMVIARAAIDHIPASTARDVIIAEPAIHNVITVTAKQSVIGDIALDHVITIPTPHRGRVRFKEIIVINVIGDQRIIAFPTIKVVPTIIAIQGIVAIPTIKRIAATHAVLLAMQDVIPRLAIDKCARKGVVALSAIDRIISVKAVDDVVAVIAGQDVRMARPKNVFDIGNNVTFGMAATDNRRTIRQLDMNTFVGMNECDLILTCTAIDEIGPRPAIQCVITAMAQQCIIAPLTPKFIGTPAPDKEIVPTSTFEDPAAHLTGNQGIVMIGSTHIKIGGFFSLIKNRNLIAVRIATNTGHAVLIENDTFW